MRVTVYDGEYTPSPTEMAEEFWESYAERQAEILYSLALIYKYNLSNFCNQMFLVGEQLNGLDDERADILSCLKEMVNQIGGVRICAGQKINRAALAFAVMADVLLL